MCILSYIYGSYSLELGENVKLFCVVQDFCLVTVSRSFFKPISLGVRYMRGVHDTTNIPRY